MTKLKLFSAALTVSAAIATPALAGGMEAIQEPGLYAFYHPNGDLGLGIRGRRMRWRNRCATVTCGHENVRAAAPRQPRSVHQALLKSICPGSTSGLSRRFVTSMLLPTDWARPCPGRTQSFCVRRCFERVSKPIGDPRARDRRSFEKFPRRIAENRDAKNAAAENIGRRIQVSRSEEARTHLTKVRCAWRTFPQHGREVLVRLLKCVLVGGIVVSAGQAYRG